MTTPTDEPFELNADTEKPRSPAKRKVPPYTEAFERWWAHYPRKTKKRPAFSAWLKMVDESDADLLAVIQSDIAKRDRMGFWPRDITKIPHPATFVNAAQWEDEWEDELRQRDRAGWRAGSAPAAPAYEEPEESHQTEWAAAMNRLLLGYVGSVYSADLVLEPPMMERLVAIRREVMAETEQLANADMEAETDELAKRAKRVEWFDVMAGLCLDRWDDATGWSLGHRALQAAKRNAQAHRRTA